MNIENYLNDINKRYKLGNSTEHTFRGDLQQLIESLAPTIRATNEPKRQICGAPDYILTKKDIPIGFIEAKDIGEKDLEGIKKAGNKEQFDRYKASLDNLIITDYLRFHLYRDGKLITKVEVGKITNKGIKPLSENFERLENLLKDFCTHIGQTIKSSKKLAEMMAGKARLLSDIIEKALTSDEKNEEDSSLKDQMNAFKQILIHDITPKGFADVYAQTIAYGMFAARLHDLSLNDFSRQEAAELIPKSNPFLRKLFCYISGPDIDGRIKWIVDSLADIFLATNVKEFLKDYGKVTKTEDPMIHFYETFLSEYDPKLRKARGVWYTPQPVVNFIVRAVDDILKIEFGLLQGLADTSETNIKVDMQGKKFDRVVHKVQILDPATGTGTFLAEVVKHIHRKFAGQQGIWSDYVETHLLPRLNGFELLMASYAMAHLKLDLLLKATGYKPTKEQRFRVFLTNSLEEFHPDTGTLWAKWLSTEANEANHIKRDTPVMVIIGNPPYSGHSSNKGKWIENLIQDYFKEPSGCKLKEQNAKWLYDDYVKFIRYSQNIIEKNQEGILAFITNNGYLDNPTFRGMRYSLLNSFDKIYSIDLHGSIKKQEKSDEGELDRNVFDIQQGVSIILAIKKKGRKKETVLKTFDLLGSRSFKYNYLLSNSILSINFSKHIPFAPNYIFKKTDEELYLKYNEQINLIDLFKVNVMGFQTHRDNFAIGWTSDEIAERAKYLLNPDVSDNQIYSKYSIKDNRDWKLSNSRNQLRNDKDWNDKVILCNYRPFDDRYCYYSYVMMDYPRRELIQHVFKKENLVFGVGRQGIAVGDIDWCLTTISKHPIDANVFRRGGINLCPIYLYPEKELMKEEKKVSNFKEKYIHEISEKIGLSFSVEDNKDENNFSSIDLIDYVYAILHSPKYRKKYKEFLKIDFPRVPYPKDKNTFFQLVKFGGELRQIHLLESSTVEQLITEYPVDGDNIVSKPIFKKNKVYINDTQYFDHVPDIAWNFYIGGYQPAQKWLKDRKNRKLGFEDIRHYQKIIVALTETDRLMKEIDQIEIE